MFHPIQIVDAMQHNLSYKRAPIPMWMTLSSMAMSRSLVRIFVDLLTEVFVNIVVLFRG
jgi:hypothetical protein